MVCLFSFYEFRQIQPFVLSEKLDRMSSRQSVNKVSPKTGKKIQETGFHEPYSRFAGILRAWLVAYGIGAPALFLSQKTVVDALREVGQTGSIAAMFLVGVSLQILGALIYKSSMWYLYYGETNEEFQKTRRYRYSDAISEAYWFELLLDVATIFMFAIGTYNAWVVLGA